MFGRHRLVLMIEVPLVDMPFVQCEKEADYCHSLRDVMSGLVGGEQPDGVDLSL